MSNMKCDLVYDTTRRLLLVLCLDLSPSMRINKRIENLNAAVNVLIKMLRADPNIADKVEISVVTYSSEVQGTEFTALREWKDQRFTTVARGGSNMSGAVLESYNRILSRLEELEDNDTDHYLPFMVLVTDGDPDKTDDPKRVEEAIRRVQNHCNKQGDAQKLIAPYVIGVGEQVEVDKLNRFAARFTGNAILIDDEPTGSSELFREVFAFIGKSVKNSLGGSSDLKELYESMESAAVQMVQKMEHKKRKLMV